MGTPGRPVTGAPFCQIMKCIEFSCIPCITDCIPNWYQYTH
jgi:hypothetical protein